jgi:hypothetical protein
LGVEDGVYILVERRSRADKAESYRQLPGYAFFLKFLTLGSFMFGTFSFAYCFPLDNIHLNGKLITYDYILASGVIWLFIFSGLAWFLSGYMLLRRINYSRVAFLSVMGLWMLGIGLHDLKSLIELFFIIFLQLVIIGLYLYKRKPVVEYFRKVT